MDLNIVLSSVLLATILLFLGSKIFSNKKDIKHPPSPPKLPVVGNLFQLGKTPHLSLYCMAKKYGPIFYLKLGAVPAIVISSPTLAKEVFKTHDLAISSRPKLYPAQYLLYNSTDVGLATYGDYWRYVKKICILQLLSSKRVQSFAFVREREVTRLVQRIAESSPGVINISKLLAFYSNDVLCQVVFGRDFSEGGEYDRQGFQKMLEEYEELLGGFSIGDFFPSMEFLHTLTGRKSRLIQTSKRFDQLFDSVIKDRQCSHKKKDHKDFIDVLLEVQQDKDAEMPLTMENVKALLMDMFAGGTDTTYSTLDWAMTELVMNPSVLQKAKTEVRNVVGERKSVTESDLQQLPYMRAMIKEVLRLHPPAPLLVPRESIEDIIVAGYNIPKRSRIFINAWAIGRDSDSWKNPNVFEPERFMDSEIDFRGQDFELLPFGAGRRMCPGITFASATIELALANLLSCFDWELPPGVRAEDIDMTEVFGITMHKAEPMFVVAKP